MMKIKFINLSNVATVSISKAEEMYFYANLSCQIVCNIDGSKVSWIRLV